MTLINGGLYIPKNILTNKELNQDEKMVLAFADIYSGNELDAKEVADFLGFKTRAKLNNTINSLIKKNNYFVVKNISENKLVFDFNTTENTKLQKVVKEMKSERKPKEQDLTLHKEIIDYFNEQTKSNFKHTTKTTIRNINALVKEEYTLDDFKHVIDDRLNMWGKPTHPMHQYLTPSTLFRESNFEKYLNHWNKNKDENKIKESKKTVQDKRQDEYKKKGLFGD